MDTLWGKLKEPQAIPIAVESPETTKASIRQRVWEFMERTDIAAFPRPVYNRIPNFKGAAAAGNKVATLPEFVDAKTIKVNPDKPQEEVRFQALDFGKSLLVPTPRLHKGLFNRLTVEPGATKDAFRMLATRQGIDRHSKPVPTASRIRIDLVVIGSVAVDKRGRRIGKGEGFADLEFAMAASHHGAVNQDTVVLTTVHDVQVFDALPDHLFGPHDLPVDIIVTPTSVYRIADRLKKPSHIIWNMMTREKFEQIDILKELRFKEKKNGRNVKLQDDVEVENLSVTVKGPGRRGRKVQAVEEAKMAAEPEWTNTVELPRAIKRNEAIQSSIQKADKFANKKQHPNKSEKGPRSENGVKPSHRVSQTFAIFVGRIPRETRVKELKDAVHERGVRPVNLVWKGPKGYAFLYLDAGASSSEEVLEKLKDLRIGNSTLNVEMDRSKKNEVQGEKKKKNEKRKKLSKGEEAESNPASLESKKTEVKEVDAKESTSVSTDLKEGKAEVKEVENKVREVESTPSSLEINPKSPEDTPPTTDNALEGSSMPLNENPVTTANTEDETEGGGESEKKACHKVDEVKSFEEKEPVEAELQSKMTRVETAASASLETSKEMVEDKSTSLKMQVSEEKVLEEVVESSEKADVVTKEPVVLERQEVITDIKETLVNEESGQVKFETVTKETDLPKKAATIEVMRPPEVIEKVQSVTKVSDVTKDSIAVDDEGKKPPETVTEETKPEMKSSPPSLPGEN